ncbi:MAG: diacylglycerol O-acyltransferase / wax synthase [Solirubrobacterales bacterium]|jgi:WS/DGAT/MGAT family acyltransferase|nr:diacylglycerol O-acyltransferase / wax synthase [Solirubrobacterales bacterium]
MSSPDRLTGLDVSFLQLEGDDAHMHVASTIIFEGPAPGYVEFRDHIESRLHLVPRFRQKLRFVPFNLGRPIWVDDPQLNLSYHVRHTSLPEPGSDEQLKLLAARIFSQQLDRSKPLWELWLVEGLHDGRFAIIGKSHHCLVDGVSGVDITTVLFDLEREPAVPPNDPPSWLPRPEPSDPQILASTLLERATQPAEAIRTARRLVAGPRQLSRRVSGTLGAVGSFAGSSFSAPPSPFNVEIGPHRRLAWVLEDLDRFKQVKAQLGGTVNDVVIAAVSGALGRYLRSRGHSTRGLELRAMVPVSVREDEEHGALGNKVAAMMAPLPVWCEDPVERMRVVTMAMGDLKSSKQAVGATLLTQLADFAPTTIVGQAARLQPRQRAFNLVITNIPGPQFPLYVLGRQMQTVVPMVPLAKRQALCVGIMSYNGQINFGLIGDYDAMSDLDRFAEDLEHSIEELVAAASSAPGRYDPVEPEAGAWTEVGETV